MSEISVLNATCTTNENGDCSCDIEELHMACTRNRTEVYETLPSTGVEGTTYLIGDNSTGYMEYIWNGSGFVEMGTASGSLIRRMTLTELGVGKLSTASVLTNGAVVGMNNDGQLMVPVATLNSYGAVKLGSEYVSQHPRPYHVGITVNDAGKLVFNLRQTQSDGSPGCLRYQREGNGSPFEMFIMEGSASQMGIVKMLNSLNGYTEEEINAMRNTHAASVGLVLNGLDSFCEWFFTDARQQGYFDAWASGKNLSQEIWDDSSKRGALELGVTNLVLASAEFSTAVNAKIVEWLTAKATDAYFEELFSERVLAKTKELVDAHWTDDLNKAIEDGVTVEVGAQLEPAIKVFMSKSDNVAAVAKVVAQTVQAKVNDSAYELAKDYLSGVVNSESQITMGGEKTTFEEYVEKKVSALVEQQLASINAGISVALDRSYTTDELFVADANVTAYNVTLSNLSEYDVLVVDYLANNGDEASLYINLNVARAVSPRPVYVAAGGVNGMNIDTKYGSNDVTPCVKLELASNTLAWWYYGPYGRSGIKRVRGLKGARL